MSAVIYDGGSNPFEHKVEETGSAFRLKKLWLTYVSKPKEVAIHANTQIKLSAADGWADLDVKYGKGANGVILPAGTLRNLGKPFGVVPLAIGEATFEGKLKDVKGKKVLKAFTVHVNQATLFDKYRLSGMVEVDTEAKKLKFDVMYRMCGQDNRLAFDSTDPAKVPELALNVVMGIGKSVQACITGATCPAGWTKVSAVECDRTCPGARSQSPGICNYDMPRCSDFGLSGVAPSCLAPGSNRDRCPSGTRGSPGFCNVNSCPAPTSGVRPSCMNPDSQLPSYPTN